VGAAKSDRPEADVEAERAAAVLKTELKRARVMVVRAKAELKQALGEGPVPARRNGNQPQP
jgi:hypothetical protein